jgi:hypothetical protein
MLCYVVWTRTLRVQRRRRPPMQLELLPTTAQVPARPQTWEYLNPEQRAALIAALARLMRKAVLPEPRRNPDER